MAAKNFSTPSDARSPAETTTLCLRAGVAKYKEALPLQFLKAVMGGILLSFGCTVTLSAGASQGLQADDGGLGRIVGGAFGIPFGLIMIVLQGMELVTSTMMTVFMSTIMRKTPIWFYPVIITVQFFGNLVGALMYTAVILHWSGVLNSAYYATWVQTFVTTKVIAPTATQIFLRGIGCNALVCFAVWQGAQARETISKIFAIWFPIFLFVSSAYDHVVANMCLITIAIFQGSATVDTSLYIKKSLLPSFAGNLIGALCVALPYTLFYLTRFAATSNTAAGILHDEPPPGDVENGGADVAQVNGGGMNFKGLPRFWKKGEKAENGHTNDYTNGEPTGYTNGIA